MGFTPEVQRNKEGKIIGYQIQVTRGSSSVPISLALSPSGTRVWMQVGIVTFNERSPATQEVLLELLGKHDDLWPAYVVYYPNWKQIVLSMSMDVTNFGRATLRPQLDKMFDKAMIVIDALKKGRSGGSEGQGRSREEHPEPAAVIGIASKHRTPGLGGPVFGVLTRYFTSFTPEVNGGD